MLDEYLPAYHTQQYSLQMQSLAQSIGPHQHSPATSSASFSPIASTLSSSNPLKRSEPPTASSSSEEPLVGSMDVTVPAARGSSADDQARDTQSLEPAKKKRRVTLTRVGDLGS